MSIDDDMGTILADALALGLAWAASYTPIGTSTPIPVVVSPVDVPQGNLMDLTGEISRRAATMAIQGSLLTAPLARRDSIVIASGPYVGTWSLVDPVARDAACRVATFRLLDTEVDVRAPGVERMPHV